MSPFLTLLYLLLLAAPTLALTAGTPNGPQPVPGHHQGKGNVYLIFLWINTSPEEGGFPAVHIFLGVTGQLNLTEIFIHIPRHEETAEEGKEFHNQRKGIPQSWPSWPSRLLA